MEKLYILIKLIVIKVKYIQKSFHKTCELVIQGKNIFIREDFSDKIQEKCRELMPQMYEARRNNMIAFLRYDKLITRPRMPTVGNDNG